MTATMISRLRALAVVSAFALGPTQAPAQSGTGAGGGAAAGRRPAPRGRHGPGAPVARCRGRGDVVLNEQIPAGDGVRSTGLTVNMIHVYLTAPVLGTPAGEIVIGAARSAASL